jgi:WD40 repeat protein
MAQVQRHRRAIAAALLGLVALAVAPALAQNQGASDKTDLYDRPVLAIDPGVHTALIASQAVDPAGRFAVTGGNDHTVRVWSIADGSLLRTIWIPIGPENVGDVYAVAISPDGSTIAVGGWTERMTGGTVIYLFDRESGNLVQRIHGMPDVTHFLTFSPDGRYLAAALSGGHGLRVFDRDKNWGEAFSDDQYGSESYGAAFSHDGRLATTSYDGLIRLYTSDPNMQGAEFGGLGVRLIAEDGLIKVVTSIENTPAAKAGLLSGDVIMAIDNAPTQGLTVTQAVEKIRAAVNAEVKLRIVRGPDKEVKEFAIVRDLIRVQSVFRRVGEAVKAPGGLLPFHIAFSPDGKRLAVGYYGVAGVDILDGTSLDRIGRQNPAGVSAPRGLALVSWSADGQTLLATGGVLDAQYRALLFAWDEGGLGAERRMTYCDTFSTASGVDDLPDGQILVASQAPCLGVMDRGGNPIWTKASPILDFRSPANILSVSPDGRVVDFAYFQSLAPSARLSVGSALRFDTRSLILSRPPNDGLTLAPKQDGLALDGWRNGSGPTLNGRALPFTNFDIARNLAIAPDAKRFFLGSAYALAAFDDTGAQKWRWRSRNEVWAVNASQDGRVIVTADNDGAIRWRRADDGRELLTLQVLPNKEDDPAKWDWVLWTPEGFYDASGANDVLKWVVNHGLDEAPTTLPVSAIDKLHRPDALPRVLDQLETAHALGVDDMSRARLDVQAKTSSAQAPGGVLHVLAIGVDTFGDKAGGLKLNYAAEDAHDVATALLESQKGSLGKSSIYADVSLTYLANDKADSAAILDALDAVGQSMAKNEQGQDVALILVSSHGEMIDGQFYLIPYGFDAGSQGRSIKSAVSASEFAKKVEALAAHGKVLLLLDACHSGSVGAQGWAKDPDAKVLQDAMNLENVTVLTSSKKNELSEELPEWKHGALTEAFLDALRGAADSQGVVPLTALTDAMEKEIRQLTKGRQHLGMHVNFSGDLFMASHY